MNSIVQNLNYLAFAPTGAWVSTVPGRGSKTGNNDNANFANGIKGKPELNGVAI